MTSKHPGKLKLYMLLLGSKAPGRHIEQHDFFFGIATSLKDLVPTIKEFWPEAGSKIHIDGWREVNFVDGYRVSIFPRDANVPISKAKLFFINLGGYQQNKFEEQHSVVLTAKHNRSSALKDAKATVFFKTASESHIDDKYGLDVDDLYEVDEILPTSQKEKFQILLIPDDRAIPDKINLGYLKLSNLTI